MSQIKGASREKLDRAVNDNVRSSGYKKERLSHVASTKCRPGSDDC